MKMDLFCLSIFCRRALYRFWRWWGLSWQVSLMFLRGSVSGQKLLFRKALWWYESRSAFVKCTWNLMDLVIMWRDREGSFPVLLCMHGLESFGGPWGLPHRRVVQVVFFLLWHLCLTHFCQCTLGQLQGRQLHWCFAPLPVHLLVGGSSCVETSPHHSLQLPSLGFWTPQTVLPL